ncbi:MAG: hypothetical protein ACRC1R_12895 [Cetobacterium sp.]|uniref:hypothetical protein n=1 Tax=Cetobacterium sp. TaxID=2071632 RepID=UPI003F3D5727
MIKIFILTILLATFTNAQNLKDGFYSVRTDKTYFFYYPTTTMTVKNGEIVAVTHDRTQLDGKKASEDEDYNKNMLENRGVNAEIYSKKLVEEYFAANKNLDKVENIAGATDSSRHFKSQMRFLIEKAQTKGPGNYIMKNYDL